MKSKYYVLTSEGNSQVLKAKKQDDYKFKGTLNGNVDGSTYMTIKEIRRDLKHETDRLLAYYGSGNFSEDPDQVAFYDNLMADWDYEGENK